jgi:hypothetical protein
MRKLTAIALAGGRHRRNRPFLAERSIVYVRVPCNERNRRANRRRPRRAVQESRSSPRRRPLRYGRRVAQGVSVERGPPRQCKYRFTPRTPCAGRDVSCDCRGSSGARNPAARVFCGLQEADTRACRIVARSVRAARRLLGPVRGSKRRLAPGAHRVEGGVIAGAGSVAVVQFRTLKRGESPLAINGVTYVVEGRQNESSNPVAYEGTITVE